MSFGKDSMTGDDRGRLGTIALAPGLKREAVAEGH